MFTRVRLLAAVMLIVCTISPAAADGSITATIPVTIGEPACVTVIDCPAGAPLPCICPHLRATPASRSSRLYLPLILK